MKWESTKDMKCACTERKQGPTAGWEGAPRGTMKRVKNEVRNSKS